MSRNGGLSRRWLRRRAFRRACDRWARFLRALDKGHSWGPYRWMTQDEWRRFVARLASRSVSWSGSDRWWKDSLRRDRRRHEAEDLRIEREQSADALEPMALRSRS